MKQHKIKLGVSLYSFSTEFISDQLDLEGVLKRANEMGYKGVEIVAAQMVPEYPYPSDEWLEYFAGLLKKYDLEPVCWSAYIDMGTRSDRDLTREEIIQCTVNDLIYAKKAGFPLVRTQHAISPEIFRAMISWCKRLDMKLAIEMHHPHHFDVPLWQEYFSVMRGEGKGVLGFVPDFSIFQYRPHQLFLNQAIELGFRSDRLAAVVDNHQTGVPKETAIESDFSAVEREITTEIYEKFNRPARVEQLQEYLDCIFYIHGKFYYLSDDRHDPCVPYEAILTTLRDGGYEGYIASEYEGHHFDADIDSVIQLQRYVAMNNRILNEQEA